MFLIFKEIIKLYILSYRTLSLCFEFNYNYTSLHYFHHLCTLCGNRGALSPPESICRFDFLNNLDLSRVLVKSCLFHSAHCLTVAYFNHVSMSLSVLLFFFLRNSHLTWSLWYPSLCFYRIYKISSVILWVNPAPLFC